MLGADWLVFKKRVFWFIEAHPGGTSGNVVLEVNESFDLVLECIEQLLFENRIYWVETEKNVWRYHAYPRPTAWEILLRDDVV